LAKRKNALKSFILGHFFDKNFLKIPLTMPKCNDILIKPLQAGLFFCAFGGVP
jgi:hypothetical protein